MKTLDLDHYVNLTYAGIVERLHKNKIAWSDIESSTVFEVDQDLLHQWEEQDGRKLLPYTGSYYFKKEIWKPKTPEPYTLYHLKLFLSFLPSKTGSDKEKKVEYMYDIFIVRDLTKGETPTKPPAQPQTPTPTTPPNP